jgi:FkbM family methyltransferase
MSYLVNATNSLKFRLMGRRSREIPKSYIKKFLPTAPIIVEAGAHIGKDTIEMAEIWPKGSIFAFEPVPFLHEQLVEKTRIANNIHCYPVALSDSTGSATMYVSSGESDGSSSLLVPKEHIVEHPNVKFTEKLQVKTITLDEWTVSERIDHVDFLWLDLQGHELAVLTASPRTLSSVFAIHTEVSLKETYNGVSLYPEFRSWLENKGFEVVRESLPWRDMGNVLLVSRHRNKLL